LGALLCACGEPGSSRLNIVLPDEAARQTTTLIRVVVMDPGAGARCAFLLDGSASPGAPGYEIEAELQFGYPATGPIDPLEHLGPGLRLFFAEAEDEDSRVILHGCTESQAGEGAPETVTIALEWLCQPTNGGVEACDGLDNDCDGSTDNGDPEVMCPEQCFGVCSAASGQCEPDPSGTVCQDGFSCTDPDQCDGQGHCVGQLDPTYCAADQECRPDCAQDAFGCVRRPNFLQIDCPNPSPLDQPATCGLVVNGSPGSEACVHCEVLVEPSVIVDDDFNDFQPNCDLHGWQFEPNECRGAGFACPIAPGGPSQECCGDALCTQADDGFVFETGQCPADGWRLSSLFDFTPYEMVDLCYQVLQRPEPWGASLQIQTDPGDRPDGNILACSPPGSWAEDFPVLHCLALPRAVTDQPQTRVTFWAQAQAGEGATVLGGASLYGRPPECGAKVMAYVTAFDSCGRDLSEHQGWRFQPSGSCAELQQHCGFDGGLLVGSVDGLSTPDLTATLPLDMRQVRGPGQLCWKHYLSLGFNGSMNISLFGGGQGVWFWQVYELQYQQFFPSDECRELCVDLAPLGGTLFGGDTGNVQIDAHVSSGFLLLGDFRIEASRDCPADGVLGVGPVVPDGLGGHQVLVENLIGQPRRARLQCEWGEGQVHSAREFEFVAP
jgi:hypothetical protein